MKWESKFEVYSDQFFQKSKNRLIMPEPEVDREDGGGSSSSAEPAAKRAKQDYPTYFKEKVDEVVKGELMQAVDENTKVKLNDDVKSIIAEKLDAKPKIVPHSVFRKKFDEYWDTQGDVD